MNKHLYPSNNYYYLIFILVIFAFIPTIQYDFAIGDQWRAFRLPESFSAKQEFFTCANNALPFYVSSGRPLVWFSECIERTFVSNVNEFWFFRLIPLAIMMATIFYLGKKISRNNYFGYLTLGFIVMLPGFQFMLQLGANGAMTIFSLAGGLLSAVLVSENLDKKENNLRLLSFPYFIFLVSCFIYPAWALSAIPFSFLLVLLGKNTTLEKKIKKYSFVLLSYFAATIFYVLITKLVVYFDPFDGKNLYANNWYKVSLQTDYAVLFNRATQALTYIFKDSNVWGSCSTSLIFFLGLTSLTIIIHNLLKTLNLNIFLLYFFSVFLAFSLGLLFTIISFFPWLFSSMPTLSNRYFLASYVLPISSTLLVFNHIRVSQRQKKYIFIFLLVVFSAISLYVNKTTTLKIFSSITRTEHMRLEINKWIDLGLYKKNKIIVVIPPYANHSESLPFLIERGWNANWSGDINHYFEVFSAILREKEDHKIARDISLVNCAANKECLFDEINKNKIIFYLVGKNDAETKSLIFPGPPFIINMSSITRVPIKYTYTISE